MSAEEKLIELSEREIAIMQEAFMCGRVYNKCGEKESPAEIFRKTKENCIRAVKAGGY